MDRARRTRPAALALMLHAVAATRPETAAATVGCNIRLTRARDFLMHRSPHDVVDLGGAFSATEFEANRDAALGAIRQHCGACRLCERFGLVPP